MGIKMSLKNDRANSERYVQIINGTYADALVYSDDMEEYARAQLKMICDNEVAKDSDIRVMSDVHPGKVGTIGLTMMIGERIIPHLLGVDIGCGMTCAKIKAKNIEMQKLDKVIRERVPAGFKIRESVHPKAEEIDLSALKCHGNINGDKALRSLGTLGGGNHFIEADKGGDGSLYLVIHTGSRHTGKEVTDHYVDAGSRLLKESGENVSYEMTYLTGDLMEDYLSDVAVMTEYAALNRQIILDEILRGMKLKAEEVFSCMHNYVGILPDGRRILRKGAISAMEGERVIIPVNMRDGIIMGIGKGNPDWNYSAPHGSGRVLRRDEVKKHHTVSEFKKEMKGIYCTCIGTGTLDEAPFAYRGIEVLKEAVRDTVDIKEVLRPVFNFKGGN